MAQKKHIEYAQAKFAPAGFVLPGLIVAVESIARMVYTVANSAATTHYLNSLTGLVRVKVTGNGVYVALSESANKAPAKATGTLTSDATNVADGETVVVGSKTYTFVDELSEDTGDAVAYEVLVGASAAASLDNLKAAINGSAGEGTTYSTGTEAHPDVVATTNTDTTQVVEAKLPGTAGNAIASTETSAHLSWGAATLASGADGNFEDYIPAGGSLDIAIDESTEVISFIADGGNASVNVVEY